MHYDSAAGLEMVLEDVLEHPYFEWPRTLISYPVCFERAVREEQLVLVNSLSKEEHAFQLTETEKDGSGALVKGIVNFFADLPSGSKRSFKLHRKKEDEPETGGRCTKTPETLVRETEHSWIVNNGVLKAEIPRQLTSGTACAVPGPLARIGHPDRWLGSTSIHTDLNVSMTAEKLEDGPLLARFRLVYRFSGGGCYEIAVRVVKGMDFIELDESVTGFSEEDQAMVQFDWDSFVPTHRYAPNRPYGGEDETRQGFRRYPFEPVDRMFTDSHVELAVHHSDSGEMPFRLSPYDPWKAVCRLNMATFWNEKTMQSVGIFIRKPENWQDGQYALWAADDALAIRYYYKNERLRWEAPLKTGSRSLAICCYHHDKDMAEVDRLDRLWEAAVQAGEPCPRGPASYTLWLQQWYSLLDLNKVKDWQLTYPDTARYPGEIFDEGMVGTPKELEQCIRTSELVMGLALYGPRQDCGFSPVPSRDIYDHWIDGYHRLRERMSPVQRRKLTGMYLLMGYLHASEDYMPMKTMLAGHPNFLADVKGVPALMSVLFPEHPAAQEWVNLFEKSVELNLRYHIRPDDPITGAVGGRWTENIACYVWAFLKPVMRTAYLLKYHYDGKNRLLNKHMVKLMRWLAGSLTSPFHDEAAPGQESQRLFLPQGAHARRMPPPKYFHYMGQELRRYDPMLAETIMGVSRLNGLTIENKPEPAWSCMERRYEENGGTRFSLSNEKYTGYGIVLRARVSSPDESFVMLQQIDDGSNYRWGVSGQGGCGVLYYYHSGRAYSHNGFEDVGDARLSDIELCTNFGVFKQGTYRSIGRNKLSGPLLDLGTVKFAEIFADSEGGAYSWPEYQSRSVLMANSDYIVIYDAVFNASVFRRFSWFVHKNDEFPHIHPLYGSIMKRTELATEETKGVWMDGAGDFMVMVTPHSDYRPEPTEYGYTISTPLWTDYGFRRQKPFHWLTEEAEFSGRAGWARKESGRLTLALISGKKLRMNGVSIEADRDDTALEITVCEEGEIAGNCSAAADVTVRISLDNDGIAGISPQHRLFVNGHTASYERDRNEWSFTLPAGVHSLEFTSAAKPGQLDIRRAIQVRQGANIQWHSVVGATAYQIERSEDQGQTWDKYETVNQCECFLPASGRLKSHIRVTALNGDKAGIPSDPYPVYFSEDPPLPPEGLKLGFGNQEGETVWLSWGQVAGAERYRVYMRGGGIEDYQCVYEGENVEYCCTVKAENMMDVLEFAVTAVSGIGESALSFPVNSDRTSFLHWDPMPGDHYRKTNAYQHATKY